MKLKTLLEDADVIKLSSSNYGDVNYKRICKFVFVKKQQGKLLSTEIASTGAIWERWMTKYHPSRFFNASNIKRVPGSSSDSYGMMDTSEQILYVPTADVNANWREENKDCLYLKDVKTAKKLPIIVDQKKIDIWLAACKEQGHLIEVY